MNDWDDFDDETGDVVEAVNLTPAKVEARIKRPSQGKLAEERFHMQCLQRNLAPVRGHKFAKDVLFKQRKDGRMAGRQWMFDFCWPSVMLAVEIEGLAARLINGRMISTGRHTTPAGFQEDCVKYANAVLLGWTVVRFMTKQVPTGYAIDMTMAILSKKGFRP